MSILNLKIKDRIGSQGVIYTCRPKSHLMYKIVSNIAQQNIEQFLREACFSAV